MCGAGVLLPLFRLQHPGERGRKKAAQEFLPGRPYNTTVSIYCLLGLLGSDFGSVFGYGLLGAGGFASPCEPTYALETGCIHVPLCLCPFFPRERLTSPCLAFGVDALRFRT